MSALSSLLAEHGLTLVFVNVLLAQLGLPLPALPMLVLAGTLVADETLALFPLALAVVAGSLLGDTPWFFAGRLYGYRILRTLCRVSMEPETCVKQTENIFGRWGPPSLLIAKYIPGFSTVAPPLAGTMGLGLPRFLAYSAVGALLWGAVPIAGGFLFRNEVEWLIDRLSATGLGAVALVAAVIAVYVAIKTAERFFLIRFLRMVRISHDELRSLMDSAEPPVILDVRSAIAREAEPRIIPGAISVDLASVQDVLSLVPAGRDVVVYCS